MTLRTLVCAALASLLLSAPSSFAQDKGAWLASSTNAHSVTGDISFTDLKLTIDFSSFTIAQIRALKPAEAQALFSAGGNPTGTGNLYRLSIPATKKFLHHNTLCGSEETQWAITYVEGRTLQLALFSGAPMPALTPEALADTTRLCGTFSYTR